MKRIDLTALRITATLRLAAVTFALGSASAFAADTSDNPQSLPDSNPACMQINGPDCVLPSATYPSRIAAPRNGIVTPPVVVPPAAPVEPSLKPGAAQQGVIAPRPSPRGFAN